MSRPLFELSRAGITNAGSSNAENFVKKLNKRFGIDAWSFGTNGVYMGSLLVMSRSSYRSFLFALDDNEVKPKVKLKKEVIMTTKPKVRTSGKTKKRR